MNAPHYRQYLYIAFSELLKEPTAQTTEDLPALVAFLGEAATALGYTLTAPGADDLLALAGDFDALRGAYYLTFCYPPQTRLVPVESVYRPWTKDPTATLPGAHDLGYLQGDAAAHMLALYQSYGLTPPEAYQAMPDHLCLQLEFAAHLLELEQEDRLATFLADHLGWVSDLAAQAAASPAAPFYRRVLDLTAAFLAAEKQQ
ncbi:MAG: molecular chaperone TorD family protein [Negativicutes bacterium]|nr:molecular chaperone TorD family protein [Negativicutes bacterium]